MKIIYMECTLQYMWNGHNIPIQPIIDKGQVKSIEKINYLIIKE